MIKKKTKAEVLNMYSSSSMVEVFEYFGHPN